jgi:hypothetical protein
LFTMRIEKGDIVRSAFGAIYHICVLVRNKVKLGHDWKVYDTYLIFKGFRALLIQIVNV